MRAGRSSQSAALVAFLRALADAGNTSAPGFADPTARRLLPPGWSRALRLAERGLTLVRPATRRRVIDGVDVVALRTLALDRYVVEALGRGVRQVVILGAGLDGRAYRLPGIEAADVFEVDHPATQATKSRRTGSLRSMARSLRLVGIDFERDSLDDKLAEHGHDAGAPTFWLWEGVVTYLTDDAVRATLRAVVSRSAPGSGIVITYSQHARQPLVHDAVFRVWGEPQIGRRSPDAMARLVTDAGLRVDQDSGLPEWAAAFHALAPRGRFGLRAVLATSAFATGAI